MRNRIINKNHYPISLKPKPDELISSWIARLAMVHGVKLHTFCSLTFPDKSVWDRDIDKSADSDLIFVLSLKTHTPLERAINTTLAAYEGMFFEIYNRYGPTAWVMPVGIYSRFRRYYGQQFCPLCLTEDKEPYYRRRWRMAFMFCCEIHNILLFDRCPDCKSPVNFHRDELGDFHKYSATTISQCYICGLDFCYIAKATPFEKVTLEEADFTRKMLSPISGEIINFGEENFIFPHLFFSGFREILKTLASSDLRVKNMRNHLGNYFKMDVDIINATTNKKPKVVFERLNLTERRQFLNLSRCLLENWSDVSLGAAKKYKVWSSFWLKHLESDSEKWGRNQRVSPYWYHKIMQELYRPPYHPTEEEIVNAILYIKKTYGKFTRQQLRKFFGEAIVYRKLKQLQETGLF